MYNQVVIEAQREVVKGNTGTHGERNRERRKEK